MKYLKGDPIDHITDVAAFHFGANMVIAIRCSRHSHIRPLNQNADLDAECPLCEIEKAWHPISDPPTKKSETGVEVKVLGCFSDGRMEVVSYVAGTVPPWRNGNDGAPLTFYREGKASGRPQLTHWIKLPQPPTPQKEPIKITQKLLDSWRD